MNEMVDKLKKLLKKPGIIVAPGAPDPLGAKLVEMLGFDCVYKGGSMTGSQTLATEPLITASEFADWSRYITHYVNIPLIVDGDAGYGDPVHTARAVRLYERAGIAAMHIEDQVFPKRVSYHRGLEHIVSAEEYLAKIKTAVSAREEMLIIARCDAIRAVGVESLDECIKRLNAAIDAGADIAMPMGMGSKMEWVKSLPKEVHAPLLYTAGNDVPFGLTTKDFEKLGWKIMIWAGAPIAAMYGPLIKAYRNLKEKGRTEIDEKEAAATRQMANAAMGLDKMWKIEEETTEKKK